jgi:ABC-type amino acid transport substrate-binding protein
MIIAAMYITDERKKVIDFSNSYMDTGIVLVKKKSNNDIKGQDDLKGKTVGVKAGAASEKVAQGLVDKGINVTIKSYKDTTDYLMDLELGRIDAALNDYLNQLGFNKQHPNSLLEIVGGTFGKSSLGIGVNKGDSDLLNVVNEVIQDLEKNGEGKKMFEKWLK